MSTAEVNSAITNSQVIPVNEDPTISNDKVVFSQKPAGGIVTFNRVMVDAGDNIEYQVPVTIDSSDADGKTFILATDTAGQFDGKKGLAHFYPAN